MSNPRVTINRINETIKDLGFEIQRGKGYYYYTRLNNDSPIISEEGVYGVGGLNSFPLAWWRQILETRIEEAK